MPKKKKIYYIVELGYTEFMFDRAEDATIFADTAKSRYFKREGSYDGGDIGVSIYVKNEDEINKIISKSEEGQN